MGTKKFPGKSYNSHKVSIVSKPGSQPSHSQENIVCSSKQGQAAGLLLGRPLWFLFFRHFTRPAPDTNPVNALSLHLLKHNHPLLRMRAGTSRDLVKGDWEHKGHFSGGYKLTFIRTRKRALDFPVAF